jgi:dipeptide transport system ATP-binding protein
VLELFENPRSPYTRALLSALPEKAVGDRLPTIADFSAEELASLEVRP